MAKPANMHTHIHLFFQCKGQELWELSYQSSSTVSRAVREYEVMTLDHPSFALIQPAAVLGFSLHVSAPHARLWAENSESSACMRGP